MDKFAEQVLTGDNTLPLFLLLAPWIGLGALVGFVALNKLRTNGNGNGKTNGRGNGADPQIIATNGQMEAIKVMVKQVLDRVHSLEDGISALRSENRARSDSDARLRERIAALEATERARG